MSEAEPPLVAHDSTPNPNSPNLPVPGRVTVTMSEQTTAPAQAPAARARLTPLAPQRFALQVTIDQETHETLRLAQELIDHPADVAEVIKRALKLLVTQLEKRKFAATSKPRPANSRSSANPRRIPAHVKRAVQERDQGQCTYVSESGQRCAERRSLQFDHVREWARGGEATVDNIRLRCKAHNQYTAECTFGAGFMDQKRREARERAETRRLRKPRWPRHTRASRRHPRANSSEMPMAPIS